MAENEMQDEKSGMSVGDIFRIIFSQKWVALIILVVVTLAGTLGLHYGSNAISKTYDVSFTLELPQTDKNSIIKDENGNTIASSTSVVYYPDGTAFYYTDIVSLTTLKKVKNSNEAFEDINVDAMSKGGGISIERTISETANNSGTYESNYKLTVKANYFSNQDVAREFLEALTKTPTDYLGLMNIDYDVYIDSARKAPDYIKEISQLISQLEYLLERYDTFVKLYNDLSIDGKTLRSYAQDINSYLNDTAELEILQAEVRKNSYLKSEELIERYQVELDQLQRRYDIAKYTLNNLLNKGDSEAISAEVFKTQSDMVAELAKEIEEISGKPVLDDVNDDNNSSDSTAGFLNSKDYDSADGTRKKSPEHIEFLTKLENAYTNVEGFTKVFDNVVSQLYTKVAVISYSNSNVVSTNGVTGLVKAFIISLVAGIVLALIVAFVVGWIATKKKASKAQTAQTQSAEAPQTENE